MAKKCLFGRAVLKDLPVENEEMRKRVPPEAKTPDFRAHLFFHRISRASLLSAKH